MKPRHVPSPVFRYPEPPHWMISEALRVLPPIEDPYDDPHPGIPYGPELRLKVYHVIKGQKVYYNGTPLPPGDGSELVEDDSSHSPVPANLK